ncbi:UDP-forming cellulose synthase catalytic subunit [Halomonas sp. H10-9-1]|uniref:UDP-forming cellulose synthase catalytic subunit n=1 Tax=Halomonas sp. H10-9-1 TaxID=2950871 RepID=UPI0032E0305E
MGRLVNWLVAILFLLAAAIFVSTPLPIEHQLVLGIAICVVLLIAARVRTQRVRLFIILITVLSSTRYLYWRLSETIVTSSWLESALGAGLLAAELYAWLVLVVSFFQMARPIERRSVNLPADTQHWPSIDVYIPTYNEPLSVVKDTVLAAQNLEYPRHLLKIYLLDDGHRPEFGAFASACGAGYITREDNTHAKAGNLNNAMGKTHGELICIFDCDHITTRFFLQKTVGQFLTDPTLALVQTPHYFYSQDPFERNLVAGRRMPREGDLFYGPVQQGNDFWNASFFCGSCAVIRRKALDDIGGFATETVTEDAHTALKLQRRGWSTAFIKEPMAAGLATERLALHIGQRARWARGMTQIFRRDNPLFGRGLSLAQRLCYLSAMLHFQFPLARVVFLTAPLAYLLFGLNIIEASPGMVAVYVLPHLFCVVYANSWINGRYRYTLWNEIYETVLAFHLLKPALVTLFAPNRGSFNVTEKGGVLTHNYFDFHTTRPQIFVVALTFSATLWGIFRLYWWDADATEVGVLIFNVSWATLSSLFLLAAIAVGSERKQARQAVRLPLQRQAVLYLSNGHTLHATTVDISMTGAHVRLGAEQPPAGDIEHVEIANDHELLIIPVHKVCQDGRSLRLRFEEMKVRQRRRLVGLVMGSSDGWLERTRTPHDRPLHSLGMVLQSIFGLFLSRWRDARLNGSPGRGTQPTKRSRAWLWWLLLVLLLAAGILHSLQAQAQTSPQPRPATTAQPTASGSDADPVPGAEQVLPSAPLASLGIVDDTLSGVEASAQGAMLTHTLSLEQLTGRDSLRLSGHGAQAGIAFSLPQAQLATAARLTLALRHSPELLVDGSYLDLELNGIALERIPLDRYSAEGTDVEVEIPPELMVPYNTLLVSLSGATREQCNTLFNDAIWLELEPRTQLTIDGMVLPATQHLADFPLPFLDPADMDDWQLPIVLPQAPEDAVLEAGGIIAAMLGGLADYRRLSLPVHLGELPAQHSILLATPETEIAGLALPPVPGPLIASLPHPAGNQHRLLWVTGRDAWELGVAARHLAARFASMESNVVPVTPEDTAEPAQAPSSSWQLTRSRLALGELMGAQDEPLIVDGARPEPLDIPFTLPPDLYFWPGQRPELELTYAFPDAEWLDPYRSELEVSLNGEYITSLPAAERSLWRSLRDLLQPGGAPREQHATIPIPEERLYVENRLQLYFRHRPREEQACNPDLPLNISARIDTDSHLDVSQASRLYVQPDLRLMAQAGFPFTQQPDLSRTTLMLPETPPSPLIQTAFELLAHLGAASQTPALGLGVTTALSANAPQRDQHLLVVAPLADLSDHSLLASSPFQVTGQQLRLRQRGLVDDLRRWLRPDTWFQPRLTGNTILTSGQTGGAALGFPSPWSAERSVVIFTGSEPQRLPGQAQALMEADREGRIHGDLAVIDASHAVTSYRVGHLQAFSDMAWHRQLRWWVRQYGTLMLIVMGLLMGLAVITLHRWLERRAKRRVAT